MQTVQQQIVQSLECIDKLMQSIEKAKTVNEVMTLEIIIGGHQLAIQQALIDLHLKARDVSARRMTQMI